MTSSEGTDRGRDAPTDALPTEHQDPPDRYAIGEGSTWDSDDLTRDEAVAQDAWRRAAELLATGTPRLVPVDEITYPTNWAWIDAEEVLATIRARDRKVNVVCTGRDAPDRLLELADTATELRVLKHAHQSGIRATKGIDS